MLNHKTLLNGIHKGQRHIVGERTHIATGYIGDFLD